MNMSTDITLEESGQPQRINFDAFASGELPQLARAVAASVDDPALAITAVAAATEGVQRSWNRYGYEGTAATWTFAQAITTCAESEPTATNRGIVAATYWLDWDRSTIATALRMSDDHVDSALDEAIAENERAAEHESDRPADETPESRLRQAVRQRASDAAIDLPDTAALQQRFRRQRTTKRAAVAAIGLAIVALIGTLFTTSRQTITTAPLQPEAAATEEPTSSPIAQATAAPELRPTPSGAVTADRLAILEPPPDGVRPPQLVATTPIGDFVGARSPTFRSPRSATFSTSTDGIMWEFAGGWGLGDYEYLKHFEQIDGRYFALVDNALAPNPPNPIKIGVSEDLLTWQELILPVNDVAPTGLRYAVQVISLAAANDVVYVLVETDVDVDYESLALVESYTCGRTTTPRQILIDLCNGGVYEVDQSRAPDQHRVFASNADGPFQQLHWAFGPFDSDSSPSIVSTTSGFDVTTPQGLSFASSDVDNSWQLLESFAIPEDEILASGRNTSGDVLGLRGTASTPVQIFLTDSSGTQLQDLTLVIGDIEPPQAIDVASGEAGWAISFADDSGDSWVLHSADGQRWKVLVADLPASSEQQLFVGDDEVLVRSMAGTGPVLTRLPIDE